MGVYTESDSRIGIGQTRRLEFASGEAGAKKSSLLETRGFFCGCKGRDAGAGKTDSSITSGIYRE